MQDFTIHIIGFFFFLTGPTLFILSLSCCSFLSPLPLLIFILGYGYLFYESSKIPLYTFYITFFSSLSSLNFSRRDLDFGVTFKKLSMKILWFSVVLIFIFFIFYIEIVLFPRDNSDAVSIRNLIILLGSLLCIYIMGSLILLVDRCYWKWSWGENFNLYVRPD